MTKTIKLALSFLDEDAIPYSVLCKELFDIQYRSAKISNRIMSYLYANKQQEFIMQDNGGSIKTENELYGKSLSGYLYDKMKDELSSLYTANIAQLRSFVENQFSKDIKKGLLKGSISLTNFKRNMPIYLHNKSYRFTETDKGIEIEISLFSREKTKSLGMKNGKVSFLVPRLNKYQKTIINQIISNEYKQGSADLIYDTKKKKWMIAVSFSFKPKECTGQNTLIVRLGTDVLLRLRVIDGKTKTLQKMDKYDDFVPGLEELQSVQKKMFAMRQSYGNATRIASANNYGKGYKKRAAKILELGKKESRFRDTFNHKISRYVVEIAKRYDCGLIELEDFSKTENAAFENWAYYDLESKITYKAEEEGIKTIETTTDKNSVE